MKRFGLIAVLFFFSAACEKTEDGFESDTLFDPVVEQIEIAGIEHNEGMAFVFDFFETESLSDKSVELLSELDAAVNSEGSDLEELLAVFEVVRTRANDECVGEEKHIVLAAIEIGTNSMSYWHENLDYWVDLLGDGSKSWFNWRRVGAYDIGGAVGGAIATAITGPGIAAGIVGGAVGASVTCAVVQVIGHYVDLD